MNSKPDDLFKKCRKCKEEKEIAEFRIKNKSTGYRVAICLKCEIEYRKIYNKKNKSKIDAYNKNYKIKNRKPPKIKTPIVKTAEYYAIRKEIRREKRHKKYLDNPENARKKNKIWRDSRTDILNKQSRDYYAANREKKHLQAKKRRETDMQFRIVGCLRSRLYLLLMGKRKSASTMTLVGCDIAFLLNHLEKQFNSKMNWENYGNYWNIDHILPCASFDLAQEEEQKKCFHYSNLQPLEASENIRKGSKILINE